MFKSWTHFGVFLIIFVTVPELVRQILFYYTGSRELPMNGWTIACTVAVYVVIFGGWLLHARRERRRREA